MAFVSSGGSPLLLALQPLVSPYVTFFFVSVFLLLSLLAVFIQELAAYLEMGFFISVAGGICRDKNGADLREAVSSGGLFYRPCRPWPSFDYTIEI